MRTLDFTVEGRLLKMLWRNIGYGVNINKYTSQVKLRNKREEKYSSIWKDISISENIERR